MRPSPLVRATIAAALAVAAPLASAHAQYFTNTGMGTATASVDPNGWSYLYARLLDGAQAYGIAASGAGAASVVPSTPGPWQQTASASGAHWIGVEPDASLGSAPGDDAARVDYVFVQHVDAAATGVTYRFDLGWDNHFRGAYFLSGSSLADYTTPSQLIAASTALIDPSTYGIGAAQAGFCRDGDGIAPSGATSCTRTMQLTLPTSAGGGYVAFSLVGDGQTDGLLVANVSSAGPVTTTSAVVPEPGTLVLLATGIAAFGGVAWRRTRRSAAAR